MFQSFGVFVHILVDDRLVVGGLCVGVVCKPPGLLCSYVLC